MAEESKEILFREMERKAQDRIRVYNPLEESFNAVWNSYIHQVPAKDKDIGYGNGQSILLRHIAINWVGKIIDFILTKEMDDALIEENNKRVEKGMAKLTAWEEVETFQTPYRTDNLEKRKKWMRIIWLGVESEFGMQPQAAVQEREDARPVDEQLIEIMDRPVAKRPVEATSEASSEPKPIESMVMEPAPAVEHKKVATTINDEKSFIPNRDLEAKKADLIREIGDKKPPAKKGKSDGK